MSYDRHELKYDLKNDDVLGRPLTPREKEIVRLIAMNLSNKEIAARLFLSEQTVKNHTYSIYAKTGCSGRVAVATMYPPHTFDSALDG